MLDPGTALEFFSLSMILAMAPGPDNLYVATNSVLWGRAAGLHLTLGMCLGVLVQTSAVALGVAKLLQASAAAFSLLKVIGACYLFYLAWQAFRFKRQQIGVEGVPRCDSVALVRRGLLMNLSNPKLTLSCLAFLPQFADPTTGHLRLQIMELGGLMILATVVVFGAVALVAGSLRDRFRNFETVQLVLSRVNSVVLSCIALQLIVAKR